MRHSLFSFYLSVVSRHICICFCSISGLHLPAQVDVPSFCAQGSSSAVGAYAVMLIQTKGKPLVSISSCGFGSQMTRRTRRSDGQRYYWPADKMKKDGWE